jgi:hypothetical protein
MPNDNEKQILKPEKVIVVGNAPVTVRELAWPDALEFLKRLSEQIGKIWDDKGNVKISLESIAEHVAQTGDLSTFLLEKATGHKAEEFSSSQALDVLDTALEMNLREELVQGGKRLATRIQRFANVGAMANAALASRKPTSSSSPTATTAPS